MIDHVLLRRAVGRRDRGATVLEVAIVAPTLFLLLIALFEMGMVVVGNSEASNAVREGARVGIIRFEDADLVGSANRQAIEDAVDALLPGTVDVDSVQISVRCARPGPSSFSTVSCDPDQVALGTDVIEVTVRWEHVLATPFVSSTPHVQTARMALVGEPDVSPTTPPAPPPPPVCEISDVQASPTSAVLRNNGRLQPRIDISWTATEACGDVTVELLVGDDPLTQSSQLVTADTSVELRNPPAGLAWSVGVKPVTVTSGSSSGSTTFQITN